MTIPEPGPRRRRCGAAAMDRQRRDDSPTRNGRTRRATTSREHQSSQLRCQSPSGTSPAAFPNRLKARMRLGRSFGSTARTICPISLRRRRVTRSTRRRPLALAARTTTRRSPSSRRRVIRLLPSSRSHIRVAVDGSTPSASARSTGRCGPRVARTTRARYWGSEITSSSAKDRAATATRTRLAMRTASARSSVSLLALLRLLLPIPAPIHSL